MVYYQAKRDLTIRHTNHWVYEDCLVTPREYSLLANTRDKPSMSAWRMIELPKYYVYTVAGQRYAYIGAIENYGKILEG